MNTFKQIATTTALLLALAGAAHAADNLLPPQRGDLVPQVLTTVPARPTTALSTNAQPTTAPGIDHRPVHVSWKLDASRTLDAAPKPFERKSRGYWQDASAQQLQQGLKLPTSAPGALILMSPVSGASGRIDPQQLKVSRGSRSMTGAQAISHAADSTQLHKAGMMVADGSVMVKLRTELGMGPVTLKAGDAKGSYVVHVFEPDSPVVLHARTDRDTIDSGQSIRLNVHLDDAGKARAMDAVGGFLTAPDGHTRKLSFTKDAKGGYHALVQPDATHADRPGLWELHTFVSATDGNGHTVLRDATTAFAVSVSDAKLDGTTQVQARNDGGIDVRIGIQAAQASRYAVSGVLYGHAADGSLRPVAYAQSANWLDAGSGSIDLRFDAGALRGGPKAPYELRHLKLTDQAHMGILERRAVALRFSP
jgi:hypothetical protein